MSYIENKIIQNKLGIYLRTIVEEENMSSGHISNNLHLLGYVNHFGVWIPHKWIKTFFTIFPHVILYWNILIPTVCDAIKDTQIRSVPQSCPTLCDPMNCSTPGLPVHHQLLEFTQTHVHPVSDAIQPSHPLSSPSPPAPNPSQHQSLSQWVNSSHKQM